MIVGNLDINSNDITLKSICWKKANITSFKGIILIVHGMAEHIQRYDEFAAFLASNDYIVYGYDQRGHGLTSNSIEEIGYMNSADSFQALVDDLEIVIEKIRKINPDLPIFLIGHSMGSFVTQKFIITKDFKLEGVVLSGSNGNPGPMVNLGIGLASIIHFFRGPKYRSKIMDNMIFGNFNKKYRVPKNFFNWLSRDEAVVKCYYEDKMCGGLFTISFFRDFLKGLKSIPKKYYKISKDLPIFLISGTHDPVGKYGKGVKRLYKDLTKAKIADVSLKLYLDGRHEMLNEINKEEVYQDILAWLQQH